MRTCSECNKPISKGSKSGFCRSCFLKHKWAKNKEKKLKFKIVIPTYKRIKKLKRLILSILQQKNVDYELLIWADNFDTETERIIRETYANDSLNKKLEIRWMNFQAFQIGIWNRFYSEYNDWDGAFLLCDDVELLPNCLENAVDCWVTNFPDGDGIIGLTQVYPNHPEVRWCEAGQILIGKKFIERFKDVNYKVHCPDYRFFQQDRELEKFSKSLNKFKLCYTARLIHYHPCKYSDEMDETHKIPRQEIREIDKKTAKLREDKGLIWGNSFELINK